jgi:hypothetical protein
MHHPLGSFQAPHWMINRLRGEEPPPDRVEGAWWLDGAGCGQFANMSNEVDVVFERLSVTAGTLKTQSGCCMPQLTSQCRGRPRRAAGGAA